MDEAEARTLRLRGASLAAEADRLDDARSPRPGPIMVLTKVESTYPTDANSFFACSVLDDVDGAETEGGVANLAGTNDATIYVANAGTSVPPVGTKMIAYPVNGRWVAVFNG